MKKIDLQMSFYCFFLTLFLLTMVACNTETPALNDLSEEVNTEWVTWLRDNYKQIQTIEADDTDYSDLNFLKPILEGKRIVQLGENCHGVSEFNKVKVRLIKFLHKVLGYKVIAFESSVFECNLAQLKSPNLTAMQLMNQSIFGVWKCEETLELFKYIKETQASGDPLYLAGFDIQLSSLIGYNQRPDLFYETISKVDPSYGELIKEQDRKFVNSCFSRKWMIENKLIYKNIYIELTNWFDLHMEELVKNGSDNKLLPLILRQTAWSMTHFIDCLTTFNDDTEYYNIRDKGMAANVMFLKDILYPGEKIILWAHNGHIQNHRSEIKGGGPMAYANNMGYWLSQWIPEEVYTIGLFMYKGDVTQTTGEVYSVGVYHNDSLENLLAQTESEYSFVNLDNLIKNKANSWIFEYLISTEWEDLGRRWDETIIHKDHFNGLIFIRNVTPPAYDR